MTTLEYRDVEPADARAMWEMGLWDDDTFTAWLAARSGVSRAQAEDMMAFMRRQRDEGSSAALPKKGPDMIHPNDCPCVVCNPVRCEDCGSANPYLTNGVCRHRRACEARQMMQAGIPSSDAARHAQRINTQEEAAAVRMMLEFGIPPAEVATMTMDARRRRV